MPFTSLSLAGKRALVTGGSRGIGREIVRLLARCGAAVAFTYGRSEVQAQTLTREIMDSGGRAVAIKADAADKSAVRQAVDEAVARLDGKLDILVNNAGVFDLGLIGEMDEAAFDRQIDVNVRGVWYTTHAAVTHLNDGGRVVNVGSVLGQRVAFPGASAYGMTKHAVAGMTRGWARDLAARGITVNVIEPGPIDTDMNPDTPENPMSGAMRSMVPMGRYGKADEVAELVAFLASPAAAYINGTQITIDGGMLA